MLGDDAAADPEAESGALFAFGGEEGLEEVGLDVFRDSGAVVCDADDGSGDHAVAGAGGVAESGGDADGDFTAGSSGLACVGDEVGEDLAEFGGEAFDVDGGGEVVVHVDAHLVHAVFEEEEDFLEHLLEIDLDRGLGLAVEAEHGAGDLGDAGELLFGHGHELVELFGAGSGAHEEEEVGDGVEGIVDLVGDGGGEASGDGEFFVGEESFLGAAFEGDVAEDEDESGDAAFLVTDGCAGVGDGDLGGVAADEDGVVVEGDGAIESFGFGDGVFDDFAGGLVEDVEDLLEGKAGGGVLRPSGELLGDGIHELDAALDVAGDDAVADGGEGGAELLFGLE